MNIQIEQKPRTQGVKTLLATLRHDLRTPINHILGYSEILLEDASGIVPAGFLRDLHRIHAGGDELLHLMQQHLTEETFPVKRPDLHQLCHQFRTPVNHIIGYTELLSEQCVELGHSEFKADLSKIQSAAKAWLELMEGHLVSLGGLPPLQAETQEQSEVGTQPGSPIVGVIPESEQGQLLLAEDDEPNRELLCRRLEKLGHKVTAVENGVAALEQLQTGRFELALLDLLMPGLDGRQVLARIKSDPRLRDLPVLMISALDGAEEMAYCIELGAEDYISKPFNPSFLRARIGASLEKKRLRDREVLYLRQIKAEKQRSDDLLHIILPEDVAGELKATHKVLPRRFDRVGVLFCDIVGFTRYCEQHPAEEVLGHLQTIVEEFEVIATAHGLEKIKTIGDSFMGTIGLRLPALSPALSCVSCGLDMIDAASRLPPNWQVRVGVHVGPVIAGVVGHRKYQYDVWGDTVNLAARMVEAAEPASVCFTSHTWHLLGGRPRSRPRGQIEIKGKGALEVFQIG